MRCRTILTSIAAGVAALGLAGAPAAAMTLVPGGYGVEVDSSRPAAPLAMQQRQFSSSVGSAGLTLDFTPRASGSLFSQPSAIDGDMTSLSLGLQGGYADQLRLGAIGLGGPSADPTEGLSIGGALSISEWEVFGSVGRANLLGNDADVFAAGLGYGRVNAKLVYGHVPATTTRLGGDVLMLSTDLAAWSWLTLQGDVAVTETLENEPLTVGRIGVRLNF